ncbi:MAG TPA: hypothetical protein VHZ52_07880 [Acidobacteriaceae bacterium]|jgi:hypothetical protein|nr:hypothetical protein [Acidobacteriaceae bacterium]
MSSLKEAPNPAIDVPQSDPKLPLHLSAKASGQNGQLLTEAEIEAAEAEALAWARRANSCCG